MVSMLLLGTAGVSRDDIIRDYLYSFASVGEVERFMTSGETSQTFGGSRLAGRMTTVSSVYDALVAAHDSVCAYLLSCGLEPTELERLRTRLLG
jgi:hypothetical protein